MGLKDDGSGDGTVVVEKFSDIAKIWMPSLIKDDDLDANDRSDVLIQHESN